jgi:histone chaperone ASF1
VGPVAPGQYRFVFQADPPNFAALPSSDIVGVTIILLTCSYRNQEFLRVGYYVNNEYVEEQMREEPPTVPVLDKLMRSILSDKPRVTKYPIDWEGNGIVAGGSGAVDTGGSGDAAAEGQAAAGDAMNAGEELADEGEEGGEYDDDEGDLSDEGAAMMED